MDGRFIIDNLLRQEKNERLDFLPKATEDMLAKTITAMLNNRGGDIVIGVDDNKRILGVSEGDISGLSKALANRIRPSAPIDIHSIDYNGTNILLISVWEGAQKPSPNRNPRISQSSASPLYKEILQILTKLRKKVLNKK